MWLQWLEDGADEIVSEVGCSKARRTAVCTGQYVLDEDGEDCAGTAKGLMDGEAGAGAGAGADAHLTMTLVKAWIISVGRMD